MQKIATEGIARLVQMLYLNDAVAGNFNRASNVSEKSARGERETDIGPICFMKYPRYEAISAQRNPRKGSRFGVHLRSIVHRTLNLTDAASRVKDRRMDDENEDANNEGC